MAFWKGFQFQTFLEEALQVRSMSFCVISDSSASSIREDVEFSTSFGVVFASMRASCCGVKNFFQSCAIAIDSSGKHKKEKRVHEMAAPIHTCRARAPVQFPSLHFPLLPFPWLPQLLQNLCRIMAVRITNLNSSRQIANPLFQVRQSTLKLSEA